MLQRPNNDGFTLIELLVVLAIVGIVGTIAVEKFWPMIKNLITSFM
jgi:prepilin-type N-terminal cleavage/methylation domain-containing protein